MPLWTLSNNDLGETVFNRWGNEIIIPPKGAMSAEKESIEIILNINYFPNAVIEIINCSMPENLVIDSYNETSRIIKV